MDCHVRRLMVLSRSTVMRLPFDRRTWLGLALVVVAFAESAPVALSQENPCETRVYNVRDMLRPIADSQGPPIGHALLHAQDDPTAAFELAEEPWALLTGEQLTKILQDNVESASWQEESDRVSLTLTWNGNLVIVQTRAVHEKISRLLTMFRHLTNRTIAVKCTVLTLKPEVLRALVAGDGTAPAGAGAQLGPVLLKPGAAKALLDVASQGGQVRVEKTGRLTAMNGQRTYLYDAREVAHVRDYDVEIATRATSYDAVIDNVSLGLLLDVRALTSTDGANFSLEVRFADSALARPIETLVAETAGFTLHLPVIDAQEVRTSAIVPADHAMLVGAGAFSACDGDAGEVRAVLLQPSLLTSQETTTAVYEVEPGSQFRVFDVRDVIGMVVDFPGRLFPELWEGGSEGGGATTEDQAASQFMTGDDIKELVKRTVSPGTWDVAPNSVEYTNGCLYVRHGPEVIARIEEELAKIRRNSNRLVTTEARFLAVDDASLKDLGASGASQDPSTLTPERLGSLLAAADVGEHARMVAHAQVTGHDLQQVTSARIRAAAYARDYDVEIAEDAVIADPIPGLAIEGVSLTVRPTILVEARQIRLDITPVLAQRVGEIAKFDTHVEKACSLQLPTMDVFRTRTTLVVPDGGAVVVGSSSRPESEAGRLRHILLIVTATSVTPE